ncbi:MAG: hypothetical protein HHJ19_07040 [Polaromonas sp.]|nr:hypothetical protein [Polaromonas sp.]
MVQEKNLVEAEQKRKSNKAWIGWTLFCVFIVGSIVFMLVIDSIYAPSDKQTASQPDVISE